MIIDHLGGLIRDMTKATQAIEAQSTDPPLTQVQLSNLEQLRHTAQLLAFASETLIQEADEVAKEASHAL